MLPEIKKRGMTNAKLYPQLRLAIGFV